MKAIVWRWKGNVEEFYKKPGIVGIGTTQWSPYDRTLHGRSGWVGVKEEIPEHNPNCLVCEMLRERRKKNEDSR